MFDSSHPPLLVLPVSMQQTTLFPSHEGYNLHFINDQRAFVSYKDGWTLPLSVKQKKFITEGPLLLVRNKGRVTSEGSSFVKGYAHQFIDEAGGEPECLLKNAIFPDAPDEEWSFVPKAVNAIWLQYGYKIQYFNDPSLGMEKFHHGKLLIFTFIIEQDAAPRLDKNADNPDLHDMHYRVADRQVINEVWNVSDKDPHIYLSDLLASRGYGKFSKALGEALTRAGA